MPQIKTITSLTNSLIREVVLLGDKAKARKESQKIVVEGLREIGLAIKGGLHLKTLIFNPSIIDYNGVLNHYGNLIFEIEMVEVTNQVYKKMAYRESTEGVIAIFDYKDTKLQELDFKNKNPLIMIAESPEKPGNIGALLRTCDAAGVDAFIVANPTTDIYNPNIIRSSVGGVFTNQIATATTSEIIEFLKSHGIKIYCAALMESSISCYVQDFTLPTAIVVGTESVGLSQEWLDAADANIIIPMVGKLDSMNVSVSAAILLFEAVRQRLN